MTKVKLTEEELKNTIRLQISYLQDEWARIQLTYEPPPPLTEEKKEMLQEDNKKLTSKVADLERQLRELKESTRREIWNLKTEVKSIEEDRGIEFEILAEYFNCSTDLLEKIAEEEVIRGKTTPIDIDTHIEDRFAMLELD